MTHTKGPWKAVNDTLVRGPHGEAIAATKWTGQYPVCTEHEANTRLIAAAPELLEALEGLLYFVDDTDEADDWPAVIQAKQALRKVKGE